MISGKLTPIQQNSITKTTVWHKKFSHISHNFVNKMRLVPIFHIWNTSDPVFLVCLFSSFTYGFWKSDSYSTKSHHKDYSLVPKVFSHLSQISQQNVTCADFSHMTHIPSLLRLLIFIIYL